MLIHFVDLHAIEDGFTISNHWELDQKSLFVLFVFVCLFVCLFFCLFVRKQGLRCIFNVGKSQNAIKPRKTTAFLGET